MNIKTEYTKKYSKISKRSEFLNARLFSTYSRITQKKCNKKLQGINIDLGSGDKAFSRYCESQNIISHPFDYPYFNIEEDLLPFNDKTVDFITLNAVLEHIEKPDNILKEINRVLKNNGLVFIRTPNWKIDFKNFYNDPTHVKPYSPERLENLLTLFSLRVIFLEPGLIEKNWFWWTLPRKLKWTIASLIKGGTKSILCVAVKNKENIG